MQSSERNKWILQKGRGLMPAPGTHSTLRNVFYKVNRSHIILRSAPIIERGVNGFCMGEKWVLFVSGVIGRKRQGLVVMVDRRQGRSDKAAAAMDDQLLGVS